MRKRDRIPPNLIASSREVRPELERLLDRLDALGLSRAAAYLSMSIDCLDEHRGRSTAGLH